eukprot:jgi/Mesvir1/14510/Mv05209-RA.1
MVIEAVFFLCFIIKWKEANGMSNIVVDDDDMEDFKKVIQAIIEDGKELDVRRLICGWFYDAPWGLIRHDNMLELLAMCFFHGKPSKLSPTQLKMLKDFIQLQESTWGISFPPGYTKGLAYRDHIGQRLRAVHRPLALYLWVEGMHFLAGLILRCLGFTRYQGAAFDYWLRMPSVTAQDPAKAKVAKHMNGCNGVVNVRRAVENATARINGLDADTKVTADIAALTAACGETSPPVTPIKCEVSCAESQVEQVRQGAVAQVFVHGLGLGLGLYLPFLANMLHFRRTKIGTSTHKKTESGNPTADRVVHRNDSTVALLVDMPNVSHRLWGRKAPTLKQLADQLAAVLDLHGIDGAHFIGHSFGTFLLARLCKKFPSKVLSATLIDPVCFGLYTPEIITAIVYCNPFLSCIRYFLVARELQVATTLCRDFQWYHFNLWRDELPAKTLVVLSAKDTIVPVDHVSKILTGTHAQVLWLEGEHGRFMACPNAQSQIVTWLDNAHKASA